MKRKFLSILLTLAMLLSMIPAAYAEDETMGASEGNTSTEKSSPRTARRPPRPKRSTAARP